MSDNVERPLGAQEALFWIGNEVCPYNAVVHAHLLGELGPEQLRRGLLTLQARYPRLRSGIAPGSSYPPRFVRCEEDIALRVTDADWEHELRIELDRPFEPGGLLTRCVLARASDSRRVLLFVFNHAIADGMSGAYLMRDLLQASTSPESSGSRALVPSPDLGTMEQLLPSPGGRLRVLWRILKMIIRVVRPGLPHQIPRDGHIRARDRRSRFGTFLLDGGFPAALAERARREGTTVHGALIAAVSLAVADELAMDKKVRIDCVSPVNIRKQLSSPVEDALGNFASSVPVIFQLDRSTDLWEAARRARNDLVAALERGEPSVFGPYAAWVGQRFVRAAQKNGPDKAAEAVEKLGTPTFGLSNLGVLPIPERYGETVVQSIGFAAGHGFIGPLGSVASTLGGAMRWNWVWVSPSISDERAHRIMSNARAHLEAALTSS